MLYNPDVRESQNERRPCEDALLGVMQDLQLPQPVPMVVPIRYHKTDFTNVRGNDYLRASFHVNMRRVYSTTPRSSTINQETTKKTGRGEGNGRPKRI